MQAWLGIPGPIVITAPLGKARAEPEIVLEPATQAVQSLGHFFSGREREVVCALVHLDAGDDTLFLEVSRERLVARYRALAEGFVEQDHPAHEFLDAFGSEQQIAVGTAVGLRALDSNRLESLLACGAGLVGCEQPFASCDHSRGGFGKEISVHETVLLLDAEETLELAILPSRPRHRQTGRSCLEG